MELKYKVGDVVKEIGKGILCHVCNDQGGWGAGFTGSIMKRWDKPGKEYDYFAKYSLGFRLGKTQFIEVQSKPLIIIANMIAQKGYKHEYNPHPLDYFHLTNCLTRVATEAVELNLPVLMPRIGCGLGGRS